MTPRSCRTTRGTPNRARIASVHRGSPSRWLRRASEVERSVCPFMPRTYGPPAAGHIGRWFEPGYVTGRHRRSRSEEHTSELQSRGHLVCRLLLEKKKTI